MAITKASATEVSKAEVQAAPQAEPKTVTLELAIYKRYNRGGHLYVAEEAYEFYEPQALILLRETEESTGRPLWRRYKPKVEVQVAPPGHKVIVSALQDGVRQEADHDEINPVRRIDIGADEDLSDILGEHAVTV